MKKTYQNPEIKIVKVQMAHMIAASPGSNPEGFSGALGTNEVGGSGDQGLSRSQGSLWDDED